jgi:glucosamine-6-phosphate deaminase
MVRERIAVETYDDAAEASLAAASRIGELIRRRADQGRACVLGLAAGHTAINVYRELIRMHREEGLDFGGVVTFALDEYWPMQGDALQSHVRWLHESLLDHVNIPPQNVHIPDGTVPPERVEPFCRDYEQRIRDAGGIDLQLLTIARTGHVGFNEPGSPRDSRTRRVRLDRVTRMDAASDFFGAENVPEYALSMGLGTLLEARSICLLALGEHKAPILRRAVEEPVDPQVAASFFQEHGDATVYADAPAAAALTRLATPWLVQPCEWDERLRRKAVIWLSLKLKKAILSLRAEDYADNGLHSLLAASGGAYNANLSVFRGLMATITGWPGGRQPGRRIVVFSPHPDDDVICMGATLQKLCAHGHEVHCAYQTSGNLAVFDHDVLRFADFVREFNRIFGLAAEQTDRIDAHIEQFLRRKPPGTLDSEEVRAVKTLIRKTEAIAAAGFCGVPRHRCHFLDMPFYRTGTVHKLPVGEGDIGAVAALLADVRPEMIFAAGDLSDPHGTHRMCLEAVLQAMRRTRSRIGEPELWLYRGAWEEWDPHEIDMAVPCSPDELHHKRHAIFRHESQKDKAMFPGPYDSREFWQRAEERNRHTAAIYDALGLPEYHGIEAFACRRSRGE